MTPKKIKSFKWNIYWISESYIKQYDGINKDKWRPVVVISSDIVKFHNQWLVIECSSHKLDEHSILMEQYIDNQGNKRESWVLPNRVHTLNSHLFKFDKKWYKPVPKEIRSKLINKFYEILTPEMTNFFLSIDSDLVSSVANTKYTNKENMETYTNNQKDIIKANFQMIGDANILILEGNYNKINGTVGISRGNYCILSGDIRKVEGNYNTIFSDTIETVKGNFNKIFGKPKRIDGNFNKYIECDDIIGMKNRKI